MTLNKSLQEQIAGTYGSLGLTSPNHANEWIFEANYKVAIAPGIDLVPAAEYVVHPDEIGFNNPGPGVDHALIVGIQVAINFGEMFGLPHWVRAD